MFNYNRNMEAITITTTATAITKKYEYGLAKFKVHPMEGYNLGTNVLGSFRLK